MFYSVHVGVIHEPCCTGISYPLKSTRVKCTNDSPQGAAKTSGGSSSSNRRIRLKWHRPQRDKPRLSAVLAQGGVDDGLEILFITERRRAFAFDTLGFREER